MSLDAFLEESHVGYTKNEQSYQQALLKLEESKRVRSWQKKQQIAYEALDICEDCIEAYMMLGTYEEDHAVRIQRYKEGMELATMNLGKDFFLRKVDDFYSIEQAKPLFHIKFTYACAPQISVMHYVSFLLPYKRVEKKDDLCHLFHHNFINR